uniref:Uncharacterized protein n=1 Tax=Meleagris gallopavo TaxID=9103 RepID=A0A803YPQ5_MELGA
MSRRRHSDDSDDRQPHKRRRTSEPSEIEERLESLICRVGEKLSAAVLRSVGAAGFPGAAAA